VALEEAATPPVSCLTIPAFTDQRRDVDLDGAVHLEAKAEACSIFSFRLPAVISALLGMQPTLRQNAADLLALDHEDLRPSCAARIAAT